MEGRRHSIGEADHIVATNTVLHFEELGETHTRGIVPFWTSASRRRTAPFVRLGDVVTPLVGVANTTAPLVLRDETPGRPDGHVRAVLWTDEEREP